MKFDNSFQRLPKIFFEEVEPTPLLHPKLVVVSPDCYALLNNEPPIEDLVDWLNGQSRQLGDQRISTRYAGHQFGVWAGQLGDGRAISLGETLHHGQRWEVQTKGSGLTPFSRMGDGKAVIRSSVREFLCSEAMHFLGVPTTRALCLITGEDQVQREAIERSALIARVFPSNLRFGHFEYAFHFNHPEELMALAQYSKDYFFPSCKDFSDMLREISLRTAKLIAQWQALGFCHGVMNSDNMSLLGLTIDYGPFGFMENFDPSWICNHSDPRGRYSFENQPAVALWNLQRLLVTFSELVPVQELQEISDQFVVSFQAALQIEFSAKLGFSEKKTGDEKLVQELLGLMNRHAFDFTHTFRLLPDLVEKAPASWQMPDLENWRQKYIARLLIEPSSEENRRQRQNKKNPKYILRNYIAQEIIVNVETGRDEEIKKWLQVLSTPFEEHPAFQRYALPTPPHLQNIEVSCSS